MTDLNWHWRSVAALHGAVRSGVLSVNNDVRIGLKYHKELQNRIPVIPHAHFKLL